MPGSASSPDGSGPFRPRPLTDDCTRSHTSDGATCLSRALVRTGAVPFWTGSSRGAACYFVHSFTAEPTDERHRLADCDYNGRRISAALRAGNVFGTQFHPEKSGTAGLQILRNFLALAPTPIPSEAAVI